jgi:hypothetical protein
MTTLAQLRKHWAFCIAQFQAGLAVWLNDKKASSEDEINDFFTLIARDMFER